MNIVDWKRAGIIASFLITFLLQSCFSVVCFNVSTASEGIAVFGYDGPLPTFTNTPTSVVTTKGSVAILRCGVENLGTKTVSWRKQPYNVPITVGKDQFLEINRFKLFQVPHLGEWNLHIKNAQIFDSGTYECQVSSKDQRIRRNITLTVLDTKMPTINLTGTQIVEKGYPIQLQCNATSDDDTPQAIDWFKDGRKLQSSYANQLTIHQHVSISDHAIMSTLEIDKARMSDMGLYICRASKNLATRIKVDVLNAETYNEKRETNDEISSGYVKGGVEKIQLTNGCILLSIFLSIFTVFAFMRQRVIDWTLNG